ncbi:MAG: protein-disulfide reductase DsbD [Betaproteobacteria bacterium]|nr:protein-disulfide reductase DsbD [Betaproteobacteria bacterium]
MKYLIWVFLFFCPHLVQAKQLLEPEQAFQVSASPLDEKHVAVDFRIADGYYLYRHRFSFASRSDGISFGKAEIPDGQHKHDDAFGDVEIYRHALRVILPLSAGSVSSDTKLAVSYQGCSDIGVCYPPATRELSPTSSGESLIGRALSRFSGDSAQQNDAPAAAVPAVSTRDESSQLASLLSRGKLVPILATFFGAGLLLAFTPCMLPMLPILSGIIIGQGHRVARGRAFALASAYVMGMAVTYALAGVAAGLSGSLLAAALQNAWVLSAFAAVFVVLSLAMFGFYELQLPTALQSRLSGSANTQRGGSFIGVTVMGVLSALIVGPCVAAPLAGALLYIARTGDAVLGGVALFVMALGMGLPLILAASAARELLPKSGPWMESVKKTFGVILLAVAIWLVTPVLPVAVCMLAWAALLIISAVFLRALDPLPRHAQAWLRFWKGIGVIALIAGAGLVIGALGGARDPLQPLSFLHNSAAAEVTTSLPFERIKSLADLDRKLAQDRPVMLDFYADWCLSCKEMERFTFSDPRVRDALKGVLLLQADVTANDAEDKALFKRFGLFGPPGILFFDAQGKELETLRVIGYQKADLFLETLAQRAAASK